jgi:hypothetical protein
LREVPLQMDGRLWATPFERVLEALARPPRSLAVLSMRSVESSEPGWVRVDEVLELARDGHGDWVEFEGVEFEAAEASAPTFHD